MTFSKFFRDRRGNVAMLFTLGVLPMFLGVGAAVDYSRLSNATEQMQNALDATALALAQDASSLTSAQLQTKAGEIFAANFAMTGVSDIVVNASYQRTNGSTIVASAEATVSLNVMQMIGRDASHVKVNTNTAWSMQHLRVALALDNTGSMDQNGKMTALKTATHNLLDSLEGAALEDGDVYVSIIPFGKDVNYGSSHYQETWLNWTDWDSKNRTCTAYNRYGQCTSYTPKSHTIWNGCVTDRDQSYDVSNTAPTTSAAYFWPEQYSSCPAVLTPATYDWAVLHAAVDAMRPVGSTNQTIGLSWGWLSLTQDNPLNAPAKEAGVDYKDVVILMTDGVNTQNRWNGSGSSQSTAVDDRTRMACDNLKAANVEIYTVLVMDGNRSLLESCATDSSHYFYLTDPTELITTFEAIGTKLSLVRLAH